MYVCAIKYFSIFLSHKFLIFFLTYALADMIDKATLEIKQDEDKTVYKSLQDIADDLPDHSPRFILLSYPLTLVR